MALRRFGVISAGRNRGWDWEDGPPSSRLTVVLPKGVRLRATTGNGDVTVDKASNDVEIRSGNGDVRVTMTAGQVDVGTNVVPLHADVMDRVDLLSGEGRFRWLHARPGMAAALEEAAREHHGDMGWVRTREEVVSAGWLAKVCGLMWSSTPAGIPMSATCVRPQ